jgi:predicted GNAT superfamily acetyltransferase
MALELHDISHRELPEVWQLNEAAVPNVNSISRESFEQFAREASYFKVALTEQRVAGFLIGLAPDAEYASPNFLWFRERYDAFMYVDRIVVAQDARRRGVGAALYRDIVAFTAPRAPVLTCEVNLQPPNEGSFAFHRAFGFEPVGEQVTEGGAKRVALLAKRIET